MTRLTLPQMLLWGFIFHSMIGMVVMMAMGNTDDPHGGVPMGVPNHFCDDGENFTSIDWDPSSKSEYTCVGAVDTITEKDNYEETCESVAKRPVHACYPEKIEYTEDIPTSGTHRPLWPQYGEYNYVPPQRWLHSLEHGAVVFLYHPCANPTEVEKFKAIAKDCLRRHIITASKRIPEPYRFAVVAWTCKQLMVFPETKKIIKFIRHHALHSPEKKVYTDGQYSIGIKHHAKMVSDLNESRLCPGMLNMNSDLTKQSKKRQTILRNLRQQLEADMKSKMSEYSRWMGL